MKPAVHLGVIFTVIALAIGDASVQAQECFMLDSNGNSVDLGGLCGGSSGGGASYQSTGRTTIIPIKRRAGNIPVIDVRLNGKTFEMMLDTGASATAINPSMAEVLNVVADRAAIVSTASDDSVPVPVGRIQSVAVGNVVKNNLDVFIAPVQDLGLLGQNFFGDYDLTIRQDVIELRRR